MMLSLVWNPTPKRIYLAGFGGGRIPLVLHHYCPEAIVECTEIDPNLVEVATQFFGVELDDRLSVTIQDGRQYLESQNPNVYYDIIASDVVLGNGYLPYRLASQEFYHLCKHHLSKSGVILINLFPRDRFYVQKLKTIKSVFSQIYLVGLPGGNRVAIATETPLQKNEVVARSKTIQEEFQFSFPLSDRADEIRTGAELMEEIPELESADILEDASPPAGYFDTLPAFNTVFSQVNSTLPCPCGSGKVYGECHGFG